MPRPRRRTHLAAGLLMATLAGLLAFSRPSSPGLALGSAPASAAVSASLAGSPAGSAAATNPAAAPTATGGGSPTATPGLTPTPTPTAAPTLAATPASTPVPLAACRVFRSSNAWNREISTVPVAADSATLIASIGLDATLHPDFSATGYGIPINVVGAQRVGLRGGRHEQRAVKRG